jgi:hypothetical protein
LQWRNAAEHELSALMQAREDLIDAMLFLDAPFWAKEPNRLSLLDQLPLRPFNALLSNIRPTGPRK